MDGVRETIVNECRRERFTVARAPKSGIRYPKKKSMRAKRGGRRSSSFQGEPCPYARNFRRIASISGCFERSKICPIDGDALTRELVV